MMQSCASAARLLGGGAHSLPRRKAKVNARVTAASDRPGHCIALERMDASTRVCVLLCCFDQIAHTVGRRTAPAGTSPVVT
jgi:hypothetical protein